MVTIKSVLTHTDYTLLRKQKYALIKRLNTLYTKKSKMTVKEQSECDSLEGLLNFLSELQDAIVADGIKTERQVFGKMGA